MLIVFEGADGTGKTTLLHQAADFLERQGKHVVILREPGSTVIGEQLREIVLNQDVSPLTETLLYAAARAELLSNLKASMLNPNTVVLLDRYMYSSLVYQGKVRGLPLEDVLSINKFATVTPDLVIWTRATKETLIERLTHKHLADRLDAVALENIDRMDSYYEEVFSLFKDLNLQTIYTDHSGDATIELFKILNNQNALNAPII
jgi:dTMP kinase